MNGKMTGNKLPGNHGLRQARIFFSKVVTNRDSKIVYCCLNEHGDIFSILPKTSWEPGYYDFTAFSIIVTKTFTIPLSGI